MKKFLIALIICMSAFIIGAIVIYNRSTSSHQQAREEATVIAQNRADVVSVEDFYWYNGVETYFTISGQTSEEEAVIVIISQEDGQTTILNQSETISESEARSIVREAKNPEEILEARIGVENDTPIWEVTFRNENGRIGYYLMELETGQWIRTIDNI